MNGYVKQGVKGILVKLGGFDKPYKLFDAGLPTTPLALTGNIGPNTADPKLQWIDFVHRLNMEMNDTNPAGSRSGDIVLLMNTNIGAIAVNEADILPGWHGAATKTESEVPMIWRFGPADGPDAVHRSDLMDVVRAEVKNAFTGDSTSGGKLRTRHFKDILIDLLRQIKANTVSISR